MTVCMNDFICLFVCLFRLDVVVVGGGLMRFFVLLCYVLRWRVLWWVYCHWFSCLSTDELRVLISMGLFCFVFFSMMMMIYGFS